MVLEKLLNIHGRVDWREQDPKAICQGIFFDSRKVTPESTYVAIRGNSSDGHDYLSEVCAKDVQAVVVENSSLVPKEFKGAVVEVLDTRLSLQSLAQAFFGRPGDNLISLAITGTNGKTSGSYLIEHLLGKQEKNCGVIGTINHHLGAKVWETELTSPDPITLQNRLLEFSQCGADAFVIEASSHALDQNRINQTFDGVIFTNLSRDHLDYHKDMESYFQAKAKLFRSEMVGDKVDSFAIINADDDYGKKLIPLVEGRKVYSFGKSENSFFRITDIQQSLDGCGFKLNFLNQSLSILSPLIGEHNVLNATSALAVVYALGLDFSKAIQDLNSFKGIPGRLQQYRSSEGRYGFVDYAHSPDSLEKAINSLRPLVAGSSRMITVFGCGGDRDKGKRPVMGQIAVENSDVTIITSDNPRTENPDQIIQEILVGTQVDSNEDHLPMVLTCENRGDAIKMAADLAHPGDCILVAGKGHEDYQIIGKEKRHFVDMEQLIKWLK